MPVDGPLAKYEKVRNIFLTFINSRVFWRKKIPRCKFHPTPHENYDWRMHCSRNRGFLSNLWNCTFPSIGRLSFLHPWLSSFLRRWMYELEISLSLSSLLISSFFSSFLLSPLPLFSILSFLGFRFSWKMDCNSNSAAAAVGFLGFWFDGLCLIWAPISSFFL